MARGDERTWSTGALSNTTEYELICTGAAAPRRNRPPSPSRNCTCRRTDASPSTVDVGTGSTLSWSSQNATSCSTSGGWSGKKIVEWTHPPGG